MTTFTTEERLERTDNEVEYLKQCFVDALGQLVEEPAVDESFEVRLSNIVDRFNKLGTDLQQEDYDKAQITMIYKALLRVQDLVTNGKADLETCDQLLIAIERIRHIVRDALDEHVTGIANEQRLVLRDIREWLPHTPLVTLAGLINVSPRTLTRWSKQSGRPPSRQLALVARLVAILRHAWTEPGVVAWFDRPRRDLDGRKPSELLDDSSAEDELIMAARSGRSQYAS